MKKALVAIILSLLAVAASGTTYVPPALLNPSGSTAGQTIVSNGASTGPSWQSIVDSVVAGSGVAVSGATGNVTVSVATNGVALGQIAQQAANTVLANATGSTANIAAFSMPSCNTAASALNWTSGSGFTCNTAINASSLGGNAASTYALLASPALTGTPTAPTASAGTNTTQIATTAFAQNAVTGGGNAGSFTTVAASSNDALLYQTTNALSVANNTTVAITTWTKVFDRVNANFNASTGVFTAPATGYYHIDCAIVFASGSSTVGAGYIASVIANGVSIAAGVFVAEVTTADQRAAHVSANAFLSSGQTMTCNAYQNSGSTQTLNGVATQNFIAISRIP